MKKKIISQPSNEVWYKKSLDQVQVDLNTNIFEGLTSQEAHESLQKNGPNKLREAKNVPWFVILLKCLCEPLNLVLLLSALISLVVPLALGNLELSEIIEFSVIIVTVIANSSLGTYQEIKARVSIKSLQKKTVQTATVLRDGREMIVDATTIVVGDIVVLKSGEYVPADLFLFNATQLRVDESLLTGEVEPVLKSNEISSEEDLILAEQKNLAFMSTVVVNGRGNGVVFATAEHTEVGKIAEDIKETKVEKTILQKKLIKLIRNITFVALAVSIALFVALIVINKLEGNNLKFEKYLLLAISSAIAIIPANLNIIVSIILSISVGLMSKRNVIVKKMESIENLGAINVICTDKTGTLTQNKMKVTNYFLDGETKKSNTFQYLSDNASHHHFINCMVLCSDAKINDDQRLGLPTELAIYDFANSLNIDPVTLRNMHTRLNELPFSSDRKMMSTLNHVNEVPYIYTKGAIDRVLPRCQKILINGVETKLTEEIRRKILANANEFSEQALRVIVFAYKKHSEILLKEDDESDLVFIGAVGIIDPPRDGVADAIKLAKKAGIKVVMITGDHPLTAKVIADNLGILSPNGRVITGDELNKISDEELEKIVTAVDVFARVNPNHKTRIVTALQNNNLTVAMTGDGVNDSPSLRKADVGIAMGMSGSDAAKEAADVILADDNFSSIINGVVEGRNAYQKVKRATTFLLAANPQVIAMFFVILVTNLPPLTATNILWFNLITETILAIPLGMAKSNNNVMNDLPRKRTESLFKNMIGQLFFTMIVTSIVVIVGYYIGYHWPEVKNSTELRHNFGVTFAFFIIIMSPIYFVPFVKELRYQNRRTKPVLNKYLMFAMILSFALNIIVIFVPMIGHYIFNVYINYNYIGVPIMFGLSLIPVASLLCYQGIARIIEKHKRPKKLKTK